MLEKKIEEHLCKRVKEAGGVAFKFTSPQRRSVPDRLVLLDAKHAGKALRQFIIDNRFFPYEDFSDAFFEEEAKIIVAAMMRFVELKATGVRPSTAQEREHTRLRALGFRVDVVDNKEVIDQEYKKCGP